MQTAPDDKDGLRTARMICSDILEESFYPDTVIQIIEQASEEISRLIRKRSRGLEELYESISELIEQAENEYEIRRSEVRRQRSEDSLEESDQLSVISDQRGEGGRDESRER